MSQISFSEPYTLSSFRKLDRNERLKLMKERYTFDGQQFQRDVWSLENERWRLVENSDDNANHWLLQCFYRDADGKVVVMKVDRVDDDEQPVRTLDEIPDAVHSFGRIHAKPGQEYIGFTSSAFHNTWPLFLLAQNYHKMGRGWFPDGKQMPERCPHITVGSCSLRPVSDHE